MALTIKMLIFATAVFLSLRAHSVQAVSPQEEAQFLTAAKAAFEKDDIEGLMALYCWDRVSDERKAQLKRNYAFDLRVWVPTEITLINPDPKISFREYEDEDGIMQALNLRVVKHLVVASEPTKKGPRNSSQRATFFVGEKDGKLYIAQAAPTGRPAPERPLEPILARNEQMWKMLVEMFPPDKRPRYTPIPESEKPKLTGTWQGRGGFDSTKMVVRLEADGSWSGTCRPDMKRGRWHLYNGKIQLCELSGTYPGVELFMYRSNGEMRLFTVDDRRGYIPLTKEAEGDAAAPK